jgi:hypothetical protein
MSQPPNVAAPSPMEGNGAYNRNSRVQAAGASPAVRVLEDAARVVPLAAPPEPVVIADYGVAEGRNSLAPVAAAVSALRARVGPERALSVVHTDLPGNDFAALFQLLDTDPQSYLRADPAAFASAVGRSFYQQILPSASVTLGWSSWAVQWLSRVPATIPDHVQVACSRDEATRAVFARQADYDWRTFLGHRSREMRTGARLVVLTMAREDNGDFGYGPVLRVLYAELIARVADGLLRADEVHRMVIPTVGRTRAEFAAPFAEGGPFAGLSIGHLEVFSGDDQIWSEFEENRDASTFGAQWAAFCRASVFPTLTAQLDGGRTDPRAGRFFAEMEAGMAARLAVAPERMRIPLGIIVLVKNG